MANNYGVANNGTSFFNASTIGAVDISCGAGVNTDIFQSPNFSLTPKQAYQALCFCMLGITMGATAPTGITISGRYGAGTILDQYNIPTGLLVNAANVAWSVSFAMPVSFVALAPPGNVVIVSIRPSTQAVTVKVFQSGMMCGVIVGTDQ